MGKNLPDFTGTYRAMVLSNTVEPSNKAKIPTLKLRVFLTEFYDEKEEEWIDVEGEHWTMTAFLTLYSKEKEPSLNHQQVCAVFGWDGCGFDLLCGPELEGKCIQVRLKESENEKFPIEISWIDDEDADPKGGFKKKTAEEIKELNNQFSDFLSQKPKKVATTKKDKDVKKDAKDEKPKRGRGRPRKNPVPDSEPEPSNDDDSEQKEMTPEEKKKVLLAKSKRLREKQEANRKKVSEDGPPAKTSKKKKSKGRVVEDDEMPADFSKKDAWFTITALRDEACDDEMQTAEWQSAIEEIAEDCDEDNLDAEGWWAVKNRVLENIGND